MFAHPRILVVVASLTVACTHDFDGFTTASSIDASDASKDGGVADGSDGSNDGVLDAAEAPPCTPPSSCTDTAKTCGDACGATRKTCESACTTPACRNKCKADEKTCRGKCATDCMTCSSAAGCAAITACNSAAGV